MKELFTCVCVCERERIGLLGAVEREMGSEGELISWIGADLSRKVLLQLEEASDVARVCCVSWAWRRFVIGNEVFKEVCMKKIAEMRGISSEIEGKVRVEAVRVREREREEEEEGNQEWEALVRNHRMYGMLCRGMSHLSDSNCISTAITASTTDNYPEESISNTLVPAASYWSSQGHPDPSVSESLLYSLLSNLSLLTQIHIHPFQAYFQYGFPIYSSKAVRFRFGYPKFPSQLEADIADVHFSGYESVDDKFEWTYTSPEYPMAQENVLQKFELPQPALCVGGILKVELLGRVQTQEMDGLYYICISHVKVVGRSLGRPFDVEILDPLGKCTLKYCPQRDCSELHNESPEPETPGPSSRWRVLTARLMERGMRGWENMFLGALLGASPVIIEEDESDEESEDVL